MAIEPLMELPPAERSMDDIIAGVIRFTLGGRPFVMATLPAGPHDRWQDGLDAAMAGSFEAVPDRGIKAADGITSAFRANRDRMLDALVAYDRDHVLPPHDPAFTALDHRCPHDEVREIATQADIIAAIREVRAVGGDPLGAGVLSALIRTNRQTRRDDWIPDSEPTNGSPPSTAGRRRRSAKP